MHDIIKKGSWKNVKIINKTVRVLSNGKTIPTWLQMERLASKI